ncbi:D-serine/D-alanine/glycine transporter [compost metagenome]
MKNDQLAIGAEERSADVDGKLQRKLSNRHIQLISIGGAIGVGLFMGSGKTLSASGTSIILVYAIIGFFVFITMRAMGELLLSNLNYKSFSDFCSEYLGAWAGYFVGWSYWLAWVVVVVGECIVVAGYAKFWFPDVAPWIPALGMLGLLFLMNAASVKVFGELEFWFSLTKVLAIVTLLLVGGYLISTSYVSANGVQASLNNLFDRAVFMPNELMGFFAGFQIAVFSFAGIELIGTTAAETKDPEKNLPKAINSVPLRIMLFYILSLGCIVAVTSWAQITPLSSPFVQFFVLAGLPMAAGVINMVVTLAAMSSANSGVFCTSRILFGLASESNAPSYFQKVSLSGIPIRSLVFTVCCMLLGLVVLFVVPDVMTAFILVSTMSAILFIFVWSMILISYVSYRNKRPDLHQASRYKLVGGIPVIILTLVFFVFTVVLLALEADTRQALQVMPVWFVILGVAYWLRHARGKSRQSLVQQR